MLRAGLKILLKDALRSARDQMRRSGEGELPLPLPGARRLSRVADDVLSSIEETVVCVRYGSDQTTDLIGAALEGVARLRTEGQSEDFEADFAATMYRLAKGILALRGSSASGCPNAAWRWQDAMSAARFRQRPI